MTIEMRVAKKPTRSEILEPHTVSVNTERPRSSVPKGNFRLGAWSGSPVHGQVGSSPALSAMSGARMATRAKKIRMYRPAIPIQFLR